MLTQKFRLTKQCRMSLRSAATTLMYTPGVNGTTEVAHYLNGLSNETIWTESEVDKVLRLLNNYINLYMYETDSDYWWRNTLSPNEFPSEDQYDIVQELVSTRKKQVSALITAKKHLEQAVEQSRVEGILQYH